MAPGVRPELDQARALRDDSRRVVAALEARLAEESGVPLKIRHNGVLGYFVEATAGKADPLLQPPLNATFIHRQTLANQVRFTTVELADLDARIAQAAERALAIEVDGLRGLARRRPWSWPSRSSWPPRPWPGSTSPPPWPNGPRTPAPCAPPSTSRRPSSAEAARHPVVEAAVKPRRRPLHAQRLHAWTRPATSGARLSIVTGPNMAGKSTFLRQNALLAVLAQAGLLRAGQALAARRGRPPVQPRRRRRRPGARAARPS